MRLLKFFALAVALIGFQLSPAHADVVFAGADSGVIAPGPGSTAAAAAFDAAANLIGLESMIDFESLTATNSPTGPTIVLNGGVSVSGPTIDIRNTPLCLASLCGGNTTSGGSQWLEVVHSATFHFLNPIQYFGAYFGGLQGAVLGQETITFFDGTIETVDLPGINGGFAFVGFTDAGASIASVTVDVLGDIVSVDDVRYGPTAAAVPEPSSVVLLGGILLGVAASVRKKASIH